MFFSIDQVLHFAAIWIAASWLDSTLTIQEYKIFGILITKKNIIYIISLVFSIFASVPIVYYIQRYWYKKITGKNHSLSGIQTKNIRLPGTFCHHRWYTIRWHIFAVSVINTVFNFYKAQTKHKISYNSKNSIFHHRSFQRICSIVGIKQCTIILVKINVKKSLTFNLI